MTDVCFENLPGKIFLCEVGPRDGLQNEKTILSIEHKIELIEAIVDAGARSVEVGSFVHPKAVPAMADTDEVVRKLKKREGVESRSCAEPEGRGTRSRSRAPQDQDDGFRFPHPLQTKQQRSAGGRN
jgi:isopropylmalate/homocitrate/citramalate synthase